MPEHEIKAVLFDLGDTLINFGKVQTTRLALQGARSSHEYLKDLGQPVGGFLGYFLRYLVRLRLRYFLSEHRGLDFDSLALLKEVGCKEGMTCSDEQWEQVIWRWYEPLTEVGKVEDDLTETLGALRESGLELGILSNTFVNRASLEKHLADLGIRDFFSLRLYSYELKLRKPDLRIFQVAAERIGHRPENILFVGDRIDKDAKPALAVGMHAALKEAYTNAGKKTPAGAWRIDRIAELPDLIAQTNAQFAQPTSV
jgi:putative hydrolase of the HAD superfamily